MNTLDAIFTVPNARKIWKQLRKSEVPIVSPHDYDNIVPIIERLLLDIKMSNYMPASGHGYLGYPKNAGCTRFVPILTKEDMTVYYLITFALHDFLAFDIPGVYGGWRSVPSKAKKSDDATTISPYFINSFSKAAWFKNWSSFNDVLIDLTKKPGLGRYVITSDIANFYDTIDVNRLCNTIQSQSPGHFDIVNILRVFLNFWDRRTKVYHPSTKGLPQEIITDASRLLANFYIKGFDEAFKEYCDKNDLIYIRWADDITVFGRSPKILEAAIHKASRLLLALGLNLNASKTMHFSRAEFAKYRGVQVLNAVKRRDFAAFDRELRKFDRFRVHNDARVDTVFRGTLGFLEKNKRARSVYALNFIEEESRKFIQMGNLSSRQMLARLTLSNHPQVAIKNDLNLILRYPYASPRAQFLRLLAAYASGLRKLGISRRNQLSYVEKIGRENGGSEIIERICVPETLNLIKP